MGKHTKPTKIYKIRTMTANDDGAWIGETENKVTKVGAILRRTSIDELPQILTVFSGKLSLIGPRSDMMPLAERLQEAIPYYNVRYTVAPGITGWAQTHQRYAPGQINPQSIEDSKVRLQYDLYYVKHRSLLLDISIALRTIKTLVSRLFPKVYLLKKLSSRHD
jgi:lipopolysaccharide/colanic/teichoic acid biosynthesis glycosyltransferase